MSSGFAKKTQKKMNALKGSQIKEPEASDDPKSKINYDSFKVNKPIVKASQKKETKVELKKDVKNGNRKSVLGSREQPATKREV